jgi:chorismate mutase/prephenate dehydrogenase
MNIDALRTELNSVDQKILELVARRQAIVQRIGEQKHREGRPTRDFGREKVVLKSARERAEGLGLSPELAENLLRELVQASLTRQEQFRVAKSGRGVGKRALILGGHGKMGRWFAHFLGSQGYAVDICDPEGPVAGAGFVADWQAIPLDHDLILVAAPLGATCAILEALAARSPSGLVMDIGSLKTPLRRGLQACKDAGLQVTSIHPMFGPDTQLLSGKHVIFIDLGVPGAIERAHQLFGSTMVAQVNMDLDEHDRLIAFVLGLSHAVNIAFFTALTESTETASKLAKLSSTTFDAQLGVASRVAAESPALYFEIQVLNEHGAAALDALDAAVKRLRRSVDTGDQAAFASLMETGRAYFSDGAS